MNFESKTVLLSETVMVNPVLLLLTVVSVSAVDVVPLYNMEVDWIIQGYSFGFQGFMVEFMGFMKGLHHYMPQLQVVQSSFRKTLTDSPIEGKEYFTEELFADESRLLLHFMDDTQRLTASGDALAELDFDAPVSTVFHPPEIDGVCDSASAVFMPDTVLNGTNLNRARVQSVATAQECCQACVRVNNCLGWTYNSGAGGAGAGEQDGGGTSSCMLKGDVIASAPVGVSAPVPDTADAAAMVMVTSGTLNRGEVLSRGRVGTPKVRIYHGTTCIHRNESVLRRDMNTIAIGRYMLERSHMQAGFGLDEYSVMACAGLMDEIWVPTEWHRGIFKTLLQQQGVYSQDIAVIPEAVDASLFDPALARGGGSGYRLEKTSFQLLSIFKWEHRKGWDVLLEAYWTAFSKEDDVVLRLRTYIPSFSRKQLGDNVTAHIERFAKDTRGMALHELAPVVWERGAVSTDGMGKSEDRALTREDMRDLMASADAFVLPTRGEGWGLPIAEAMSMALPTIVTNATGPTAYATDENAYLIDASGPGDHMGYVQPSVAALVGLLKKVQCEVGTGEAAAKGAAARRTMQELSPHKVVAMMVERIREHALRRGYSSI